MKNGKVIVVLFSNNICGAVQPIFPRKCGKTKRFEFGPSHRGPPNVSEHVMSN